MNPVSATFLIALLKASINIEGDDAFISYDKLTHVENMYAADIVDEIMNLEDVRIMDTGILVPKKYFE